MLRHNKETDRDSGEFIDTNDEEGTDGASKLLGLINKIRKTSEDDDLSEADGGYSNGRNRGNNTDDSLDDSANSEEDGEEKSEGDTPSDTDIEEEEEEAEWEAEAETLEVLDDPVRMYLREIGRVRLLTSADERPLATKLEGQKQLRNLEKNLTEIEGHAPKPWEISRQLLHNIVEAGPLNSNLFLSPL